MDSINLTLGTKLELERYNYDGERLKPILVSQFEAIISDGSMEILAPIYEGRFFPIQLETQLDVIYQDKEDLYKFSAVVLGRKTSGNVPLLRIQPTSDPERFQRRTFYRFSSLLDIRYCLFNPQDINSQDHKKTVEYKISVIKDLSGGGMAVLLNEKPCIGWKLEAIINVGREVHLIGKIVRVTNLEDKGKYDFEIGVEFTDITDRDRESIISYIFDSQRKLLKKGWHNK